MDTISDIDNYIKRRKLESLNKEFMQLFEKCLNEKEGTFRHSAHVVLRLLGNQIEQLTQELRENERSEFTIEKD